LTAPLSLLPLAQIKPGQNPRRYFDAKKHEELVASIRLRGLLQPLLIRPVGDDHIIVAGERRYRAALEVFGDAGEVPVIVREMTDQEALEAAIDENDVRDDASETEQADAAVRVLAACQDDRAEAARRLGWSPAKFDRRLALANLSPAVKLALDERRIKVGHAELLAVIPSDKQDKALETITSAGLDVAKTRELLMRVTQNLGAATFDKTECTTCPFNAGAQRVLFETHVDDGHCTNPGCFQLKTEAVLLAPAETAAPVASAAPEATTPAAERPAPCTSPTATPPIASAAPARKSAPAPAAQPAITAKDIAGRTGDVREAAWRAALIKAGEGDPEILEAFEATLRDIWRVDADFLGRFGKDELKFIARECGLIKHMGEKNFAKIYACKVNVLIAGMLNATGFDWAGRLPSALTLDGKYGPPPAPAAAPATIAEEA